MEHKTIKQMQDRVEAWVSQPQHEVKYFPIFQILGRLIEEVWELEIAVSSHDGTNEDEEKLIPIKKEIGDVLLVICCMANSEGLTFKPVEFNYVGIKNLDHNICLNLYRLVGAVSVEISDLHGFRKKKDGEKTDSLQRATGKAFYLLQKLCDYYKLDMVECFDLTMEKKESRDKHRFAAEK